jgi:hypothetical protein
MMTAADVIAVLGPLEEPHRLVWNDGGWGSGLGYSPDPVGGESRPRGPRTRMAPELRVFVARGRITDTLGRHLGD